MDTPVFTLPQYLIELREYPLEELAEKLMAELPAIRSVIDALVMQGLATMRTRQSSSGAQPTTTAAFSFVGVVSINDITIRCLPKFYVNEECGESSFSDIVKVIFKQRSSTVSPNAQLEDSLDSMQSAMDEAVYFIADYLQNGEYPANTIVREDPELGEIDWERTIAERDPWISNGSIVYLETIHTYTLDDTDDYCRRLHLAIVSDCFRFLKKVGIAETVGIGAWPPSESKATDFGNSAYILSKIRAEKQVQFNDRRLQLLTQMERHIERVQSLRRFGEYGFFGTSHFEIVWETLCAFGFSNQRDIPIAKCLPGAMLPYREYAVSLNSSMNELIERPMWSIHDQGSSYAVQSHGKQLPDLLLVRKSPFNQLIILDAKYYSFITGDLTIQGEPGVEDVVKQQTYQMALQDFADANGLDFRNAFLFPTEGASEVIGEVSYAPLVRASRVDLKPIKLVRVNVSEIINCYLASSDGWHDEAESLLNLL